MNTCRSTAAPLSVTQDLSPIPEDPRAFARIEGLVGEAALLAILGEQRKEHQRERLRAITDDELSRETRSAESNARPAQSRELDALRPAA